MELNTTTYLMEVGYAAPVDPKSETVKILTFIDGSIEILNYGSRQENIAEFTIQGLSNTQFVTLVEYLMTNAGEKVLLKLGAGEELFPNVTGGGGGNDEFYVYILEPKNLQEQDFSTTRELFTLKLKVALAGTTSGAVPNEADTSLIDICIKVDTIMAFFIQPGFAIPLSTAIGERWLNTDDNNLYEAESVGAVTIAPGKWVYLYTVHADDTDYGFVNGSFYLSAFSTISQDNPPILQDFVSGIMNYKSVAFPDKNIDIDGGPNIARKEGFSFSFNNGAKFWDEIVNDAANSGANPIPIQGAVVTQYLFKNTAGVKTLDKIATGKVKTIDFSYTDYKCKVEPYSLNSDKKFSNKLIDDTEARYKDVKADMVDNPVYRTFGEFEKAALQNTSTAEIVIQAQREFHSGIKSKKEYVKNITAQIQFANDDILYIRKTTDTVINNYTFDADDITDMGVNTYIITVMGDSQSAVDDSNIGEVREIIGVNDAGGDYLILTLDSDLPYPSTTNGGAAPTTDDTIVIQIKKFIYRYQIDEDVCNGFGIINDDGTYVDDKIELFQLDDRERNFIPIPNTEFAVNADKNLITLNPLAPEGSDTVITFKPFEKIASLLTKNINNPIKDDGLVTFQYLIPPSTPNLGAGVTPPANYEYYRRAHISNQGVLQNYLHTAVDSTPHFRIACEAGRPDPFINNTHYSDSIDMSLDPQGDRNILQANTAVIAFKFKRIPSSIDGDVISNTNVRLVVDFTIKSTSTSYDLDKTAGHKRRTSAPFEMFIRFKKHDGTFIENGEWTHSFSRAELGVNHQGTVGQGRINITNRPDGDLQGAFTESTTSLSNNYSHEITEKADVFGGLPANTALLVKGDKAFVNDGDRKIYTWDGAAWGSAVVIGFNSIVYHNDRILLDFAVYKLTNPGGLLTLATDGVDFNTVAVYNGRDMFDLTNETNSVNDVWDEVESMELIFVNQNLEDEWNIPTRSADDTYRQYFRLWDLDLEINNDTPTLYGFEEMDAVDKPLFSAVKGQDLPSFRNPYWITKDIMDVIYAGQYNAASIVALNNLVTRVNWDWRRQFTEQMSDEDTLQEILLNFWACAIINEDDEIEFVSLNPEDHKLGSPIKTFNDANIIVDSISNPRFRDLNDMYSDFEIGYDYNVASEFSNAIDEYESKVVKNESIGSTEVQRLCKISKDIHNIKNKMRLGLKYHYKGASAFPLGDIIAKWFVLNVWKLKFKVSLSNLIGGNTLELMNYVKVNSSFFTNAADVEGFISSIKPLPYDGIVEVGMHVYRPPGVFGPLCDNFKDALTTDRDISGWGSDKKNDAGDTSRITANYTKHDAGTSPRTLSC